VADVRFWEEGLALAGQHAAVGGGQRWRRRGSGTGGGEVRRGRIAVLAIAMAALAAAGIVLVSFVLARAVQEKAPLPPLLGRAAPMAPAARPRFVVVGGHSSGHTRASILGMGMFLFDRHALQPTRTAALLIGGARPSSPRAPVSGRGR
jgi:hypothetical protein